MNLWRFLNFLTQQRKNDPKNEKIGQFFLFLRFKAVFVNIVDRYRGLEC